MKTALALVTCYALVLIGKASVRVTGWVINNLRRLAPYLPGPKALPPAAPKGGARIYDRPRDRTMVTTPPADDLDTPPPALDDEIWGDFLGGLR